MQQPRPITAALTASLIALATSTPSLAADTFGARMLKVSYTDASQVKRLAELGADICARGHGFVEVMVPSTAEMAQREPELARAISGMRATVLSENPGARAQALAQSPDLGLYHTLAEVKSELDATVAAHGDICKLSVIGKTLEGRDIWALRIGKDPVDGNKPTFLFTGLHHAREWISVEVPMGLIKKLTGEYGNNAATTALVDGRTIWVVPVVNPDGLNHSQTQYQMWRKNRRPNGDQTFGVDPNRNYSYKWGGVGSSDSTSSDTYHGPSAGSELEVQAVCNLARAHRPVAAISFHSYSELVLWPWGYTNEPTGDAAAFTKHGQAMAQFNGYTPEQSIELYPTTGDFDDFMYGELNVLSYTIELGKEFIPEESEIAGIVEKNLKCCMYLLENATEPFPLVAHTALTTQTSANGPYPIAANLRLASHPGFTPKSVEAFWKRDAGQFASASLSADANDSSKYTGSIPGTGFGKVSYYLMVTGTDGSTHRFPDQGTYDFKVVEKLVLLVADDGGKGYGQYYTKALDAAGIDYALWDTRANGPVAASALMPATACVWFTGSEYANTLTADDQAALTGYLSKGGRLLLFGQDIGYEIKDTAFYKQRLAARFVKDSSGVNDVNGAASGFLSGFTGAIGGSADSVKQQYPDVMDLQPAVDGVQSAVLLTYGAGGPTAALSVTTATSRLAYFGFGLEGIAGEANRAALVAKAMAWLSGSVQVALERSAGAAHAGAPVASEAMDDELAARLAMDVALGKLDGVRQLASKLGAEGPAQRVARSVLRRLPVTTAGATGIARSLLARDGLARDGLARDGVVR